MWSSPWRATWVLPALVLAGCQWVLPFEPTQPRSERSTDAQALDRASEAPVLDLASAVDVRLGGDRAQPDATSDKPRDLLAPELKKTDAPKIDAPVLKSDGIPFSGCDLAEGNIVVQGLAHSQSCSPTMVSPNLTAWYVPGPAYSTVGAGGLYVQCSQCSADVAVRLSRPGGGSPAAWNLSGYDRIRFYFRTNIAWNTTSTTGCPVTPSVVLRDSTGGARVIKRSTIHTGPDPISSLSVWLKMELPIDGYQGDYAATGNINLGAVTAIDIVFSNPTNPSYLAGIDGVSFFHSSGGGPPFTQCP